MANYRPDPASEWLAAVRGRLVLLVPSSAAETLAELWPHLADSDPTARVLDRLTAGGVTSTPPFALVVRGTEGGALALVRGPLEVRAGETTVTGEGVSTWAERVLAPSEAGLVVRVAAQPADAARELLPVVEAVVPAVSVTSAGVEPVAASERPATRAATPPAGPPTPPVAAPALAATTQLPDADAPAVAAEQTMVPVEDTIAVPASARRLPTPAPAFATPAGGVDAFGDARDGDHDGLTVASIDLRRLREQRAERATDSDPADRAAAPAPAAVTNLRMPDGALESIGHEVVLGRAPSVSQVSGVRLPRLVTIGAGDPDISRNHLRVALEGGTVVVTDLHSRNGTHVVAPGKAPVKLRAGEPTPVLAGTVLDLGGGWTIQVVGD